MLVFYCRKIVAFVAKLLLSDIFYFTQTKLFRFSVQRTSIYCFPLSHNYLIQQKNLQVFTKLMYTKCEKVFSFPTIVQNHSSRITQLNRMWRSRHIQTKSSWVYTCMHAYTCMYTAYLCLSTSIRTRFISKQECLPITFLVLG